MKQKDVHILRYSRSTQHGHPAFAPTSVTMSPPPLKVFSWDITTEHRSVPYVSPDWSSIFFLGPQNAHASSSHESPKRLGEMGICLLFSKLLSLRTRLSLMSLVGCPGLTKPCHLMSQREHELNLTMAGLRGTSVTFPCLFTWSRTMIFLAGQRLCSSTPRTHFSEKLQD